MQIVRRLDAVKWKQYVGDHPQGNIFHTPEMFQAYAHARGYFPRLWAAVAGDGEIKALFLPVHITLFSSLLRPFTGRAVAFGSVLSDPNPEGQEALDLLLDTYARKTRNEALFTELRNLTDMSGMRPTLEKHGFVYEDHLNFLIDLDRPIDDIWSSIRSNAQRNIKKARKMGVEIEDAAHRGELPQAYAVLKEVYKRIQVPLPDISLFEAAFDILHPCGMLKMLLAKVEGQIAGILFLLLYKDNVFYWYTGTSRAYSAYRTNDLLVWHALEFGQTNGYRTFDFGGGGKPDEDYGVRDFKAKYGGQLVNYGRNVRIHSPIRFKVSQEGYQLVRKFL